MKEDKNRNADPVEPDKAGTGHLMTRRHFLKVVGAVTTAAGVGVIGTGCEPVEEAISSGITNDPLPLSAQYPAVPYTPAGPPPAGTLRFFTPHEARTVEALTARLLPGTPDDPGAREAGVVYYIDNVLAAPEGFNEPIYRRPPRPRFFASYKAARFRSSVPIVPFTSTYASWRALTRTCGRPSSSSASVRTCSID